MRRTWFSYIGWALIAACLVFAVVRRPRGVSLRPLLPSAIALVFMGLFTFFGAWLIHEQFGSMREMSLLVTFFALSAGVSTYLSRTIARGPERSADRPFLGTFAGMAAFTACMYLTVYYVNQHLLIVFGL